jgi:hypothetical protein
LKAEREKDIALLQKDLKYREEIHINALLTEQAATLRASGLLTGRGVFEWTLQCIFTEEGLKGAFNASATCKHIATGTAVSSFLRRVTLLFSSL